MSEHSRFAPSSLFRTRICPGWIKEAEGIEEQETDEALEGEASHYIGEQLLRNRSIGSVAPRELFVGQTAPNGVLMTDEMYDCAEFYADYVTKYVMHWSEVYIECQLDIVAIHDDCFGTPDVFMFYQNASVLHVMDYKYGHRRVQAYANDQLMSYAIGACEKIGVVPETIVLHIIQPRCFDGFGATCHWSLTYGRLMDEIEEISNACVIAVSDEPFLMTSVEGCRDCPARYRCSALGTEVTRMPVSVAYTEARTPAETGYELKVLTDYMAKVKARIVGLEEEVKSGLASGINFPGWSMQQKFGHNKWKVGDAEVIAMGELFGCDFADTSAVSPAQANKLLKQKNIDASVISNYYEKAQSGMALVASDSIKATMIFGE